MTIDPIVSLALSIHAHKGVYALLLGSGISRAAGVPTGWDIVKDLARRLARLEGNDPGGEIEEWYQSKFGKAPNYSELIKTLAPTAPERASLLREYFEPTEEEKEAGLKVPTLAHQAIARLVAGGYLRVIVTTNFDRLLERAIENEGISPTVVSSADHIEGMMPLPHVKCLVFKVHGDYLDTRIKNTPEELERYERRTNGLLDRILTEYGLIVCGWSGEWDTALANAILRTTRHRFSTYWLVRGALSTRATEIVSHRQATVVPVESADSVFADLEAKVDALESLRLGDPISPRLAVATMKKYLSEEKYRIQLEDFVVRELLAVAGKTSQDHFPLDQPQDVNATYRDRVERMEIICANLIPMVATGVYWGDARHDHLWKRCVETLARREERTGSHYYAWLYLHYYPVTMIFYAAGISAIVKGRYELLKVLLEDSIAKSTYEQTSVSIVLGAPRCFEYEAAQVLHENAPNKKKKTPGSDWMAERLRPILLEILGSDIEFDDLFDELELMIALVAADQSGRPAIGRFGWRQSSSRGYKLNWHQRIKKEIDELGTQQPLLVAGMFNKDVERLQKALQIVGELAARMAW